MLGYRTRLSAKIFASGDLLKRNAIGKLSETPASNEILNFFRITTRRRLEKRVSLTLCSRTGLFNKHIFKGISLSGGQKQRLNICRAIYCNTEIQIFDDPLSALDAHVGKTVFQRVLQNSPQGKTRILVTHALHFLPYVDYVFVMLDGRIVERGAYAELIANNGAFSKFVQEFGNDENENEDKGEAPPANVTESQGNEKRQKTAAAGAALMQAEERNTGAVSGAVYAAYFRAGRGGIVLPLLFLSLVMMQASSVMSSYWLVYWQDRSFNIPQGAYVCHSPIFIHMNVTYDCLDGNICWTWSVSSFLFLFERIHVRGLEFLRLKDATVRI